MLTHCFGNLKNERDQAAALKRLKRGSLNKDGFYRNEFYEFNLQLPKAWIGSVSDPPTILTALPPEKEILDSNARKFVDIQVQVMMASSDDTIDLMIERYSKANDYELINQKNTKIEKAESKQCVFNGKWKDSPIKVISLVVFRDKKAVIVQCRALRPLYDNVFAHFASCLNSFIVTSSEAASATPTPTPNPFDRNADFIIYAVQSGDTPAGIAERFMGEAERASDILAENKIERFTVART